MKVLYWGCENFSWSAISKLQIASELEGPVKRECNVNNALVCLFSIEKNDTAGIADRAILEIHNIIQQYGPYSGIVAYPYAHLAGEKIAGASMAKKMSDYYILNCEKLAKERGILFNAAPFGWLKSLSMATNKNLKSSIEHLGTYHSEKSIAKQNHVRRKIICLDNANSGGDQLKIAIDYIDYENKCYVASKSPIDKWQGLCYRAITSINPLGQLSFFDSGYHFKKRLQGFITNQVLQHFDSVHIMKSPNLFKTSDPLIADHVRNFPTRQFSVNIGNENYMMRYATCPQAIRIAEKNPP